MIGTEGLSLNARFFPSRRESEFFPLAFFPREVIVERLERSCLGPWPVDQVRSKVTVLRLAKPRNMSSPRRRPMPLFFQPPNGPFTSASLVLVLTLTIPASNSSAILNAVFMDEVNTAMDKPYWLELASSKPSSALFIFKRVDT